MKKLIGFAAFLMLGACSQSAKLNLQLTSNDSATAALQTGTASQALTGSSDLTTVQQVNVTVNQVSVHVDDGKDEMDEKSGEVDGTKVKDDDGAWQVVSSTPQAIDLMSIRAGTHSIGTVTLPAGKITQVRLALKTDGDAGNGDDRITGAVVDSDGTICDLIVPHSAANPGIKIEGLFKAEELASDSTKTNVATVNIKLKDSQKLSGTATCAFRLNPVIEIEKFEQKDDDGSGETEHSDGGSDDHADGGI